MLEDPLANCFAEIFEIVAAGIAGIDHEVAMERGHLSAAADKPAASRLIDQLPGGMTLRILEGRPARLFLDRLDRFAVLAHRIHLMPNLRTIVRIAFEDSMG